IREENNVVGRDAFERKPRLLPGAQTASDDSRPEPVLLKNARNTKTCRLALASAIQNDFFVSRQAFDSLKDGVRLKSNRIFDARGVAAVVPVTANVEYRHIVMEV